MKKVIALGGSNSRQSINKRFATYAANQLKDVDVQVIDLNDFSLPIYGIDTENDQGFPNELHQLNDLIDQADGLVISLAEHNGSYTAAFKNTFDWLSRIDKIVWKNKPMLLLATSPGGRGGASVLQAAKSSFPHLGGNLIADFSLPSFYDNFSEEGLTDPTLSASLNEKITLFQKAI